MPGRIVQPRHLWVSHGIAAGIGTAAGPLRTPLDLGHTVLRRVSLTIPSGCVGLVGYALELAGSRIVPFTTAATFVTGNGQTFTFDIDVEVDSGLRVAMYNLDAYDHSPTADYVCDDLALAAPDQVPSAIVPVS